MSLLLLFGSSGGGGSVTQTVTVQAQSSMTGVSLRLRSQLTGAIVATVSASETASGSGVYTAAFSNVAAGTYFVQLTRDSDSAILRFSDATLSLVTAAYPVSGSGGPAELDSAGQDAIAGKVWAFDLASVSYIASQAGYVLLAVLSRFTGMTSLANWLRRAFRKDTGTAGMITAEAEINTGGTSTRSAITDNLEAIYDNGGGGGGSPVFTAVVVARVATGSTAGWPADLTIGDGYLSENASAPILFIKDVDDNILSGLGTKLFSDVDFVGTLRLAPLTDGTRTLDSPPTTIEVTSADDPGVLYDGSTPGAEYFELQIPQAKTLLGVTKTRYSCQFIMNWGIDQTFERTVNLGEIKFLRKNAASA